MFKNAGRIAATALFVTASMLVLHASPSSSQLGAIRPTAGEAFALVETARRGSPTISRLLRALEESDLVVYVEVHRELKAGVGQLSLLTAVAGVRRFRIALDRHLGTRDQIVVLGHELYHATELARAPGVVDQVTMKAFYEEVGFRVGRKCGRLRYDTADARKTAREIAQEVDTSR